MWKAGPAVALGRTAMAVGGASARLGHSRGQAGGAVHYQIGERGPVEGQERWPEAVKPSGQSYRSVLLY